MLVGDKFSLVISTTPRVCQDSVLAPDLFCCAIDWLMLRVKLGRSLGIRLGHNTFLMTWIYYAHDGAMLPSERTFTAALLDRFEEAGHLGSCFMTHVSWAKNKIQNVGQGDARPVLSVTTNAME